MCENNPQDVRKPGDSDNVTQNTFHSDDVVDLVSLVKAKPLSCFQDHNRCEIDSATWV